METRVRRVVALGASNLTRGLHSVVATARAAWGPDVEVLGALGHGRSYGVQSRLVVRTLPGILQSGLWDTLASMPPAATRGLVTDVGNDILYEFPAPTILDWVEEAVDRLQGVTADIVVTDLPMHTIRGLPGPAFLLFRSIFAPKCRLSFAQVVDTAERVNAGLESIASSRGLHYVRMDPRWYGLDPIHIRPGWWHPAWQKILGHQTSRRGERGSWSEGLELYFRPPERQWLFGVERTMPQRGHTLPRGGKVWLF
jgi:hypothetical protein